MVRTVLLPYFLSSFFLLTIVLTAEAQEGVDGKTFFSLSKKIIILVSMMNVCLASAGDFAKNETFTVKAFCTLSTKCNVM